MILVVDNYDSFTFNLYQLLAGFGPEVRVLRNDAMGVEDFLSLGADGVVLSPGPGRPASAGVLLELLKQMPAALPVLGVCLGHQALVEAHGGSLGVEEVPTHGKSSLVHHEDSRLMDGLPNPFPAARYHSLRAERGELPEELRLTAWTEEGVVMGVEHRCLPRFGVQFHPESILTPLGPRLVANFLRLAGEAVVDAVLTEDQAIGLQHLAHRGQAARLREAHVQGDEHLRRAVPGRRWRHGTIRVLVVIVVSIVVGLPEALPGGILVRELLAQGRRDALLARLEGGIAGGQLMDLRSLCGTTPTEEVDAEDHDGPEQQQDETEFVHAASAAHPASAICTAWSRSTATSRETPGSDMVTPVS